MKKTMAFVAVILLSLSTAAFASETIQNWSAASTWTPPSAQSSVGRSPLIASNAPLPFVPVTPCRVADTRGNGFTGQYGPPSLAAGAPRSFAIAGQCGISATAAAVSFNFTVVNTLGSGFLKVYPQGGVAPTVSTLNYVAGQVIANAAIAPLGSGGLTTVAGAAGFDLLIDVNGYYSATTTTGTFTIVNASGGAILGEATSGGIGVYGFSSGTGGWGVFGANDSATGYGVYGFNNGGGIGVFGSASTNVGTKGLSTSYDGVWAESTNLDGLFASGGRDGAFITGARFGVNAETSSTAGTAAGVRGVDGSGAISASDFSAGVRGEGRFGVWGLSNTAAGCGVCGTAISPTAYGVFAFGEVGASGAKPFVEPHPTDPNLTIRYVALEGPEAGTYFRGTARTAGGEAVIEVPDTFRIVTDEEGLTVQLTPVGEFAQLAVMSENLNQIVVRSSRDVTFHYHVNGIRRAFKNWQVVAKGSMFQPVSPDQKMPSWLTEEAKSRLISNGTYNPDGTVNMSTAERLGWAQKWREEAAQGKAVALQPTAATPRP